MAGSQASARLRIGIVGLGEAGATIHLPALSNLRSAELVGACDADRGRRDRAAERWKTPVFEDLDSLLREGRPDAVVIATPPASHASLCLQALAAGVDIFCEKPFVSSVEEADRVIAAADAAGRLIAVNHEFREMPIFRAVIDAVRGGGDGELLFAQAWQQIDLPPWREDGWRGALARRTLFEAGVHQVDVLLELFGEAPHAVRACTSSAGLDAQERDALVVAILEFSRRADRDADAEPADKGRNAVIRGARRYDTRGLSSFIRRTGAGVGRLVPIVEATSPVGNGQVGHCVAGNRRQATGSGAQPIRAERRRHAPPHGTGPRRVSNAQRAAVERRRRASPPRRRGGVATRRPPQVGVSRGRRSRRLAHGLTARCASATTPAVPWLRQPIQPSSRFAAPAAGFSAGGLLPGAGPATETGDFAGACARR